jgi:small subunit ribosomal protein S16
MVKIRLRRTGAKKQPHYRVVVTDSKAPRDGRFIETIGHYNPRTDPPTVEIDAERALYWLSVGAQPSAAVKRLFDRENIMSQVGAVRKGEVSIQELAAEFRKVQTEEEASAAVVLEPVLPDQEEAETEEPAPAEEQAYPEPSAVTPTAVAVEVPVDVAEMEEEAIPAEFDDEEEDDYDYEEEEEDDYEDEDDEDEDDEDDD